MWSIAPLQFLAILIPYYAMLLFSLQKEGLCRARGRRLTSKSTLQERPPLWLPEAPNSYNLESSNALLTASIA